jgi:hypothetical protein
MSMLRLGVCLRAVAAATRERRGDEGRIASEAAWVTVVLAAAAVGFGAFLLMLVDKVGQTLERFVTPGS